MGSAVAVNISSAIIIPRGRYNLGSKWLLTLYRIVGTLIDLFTKMLFWNELYAFRVVLRIPVEEPEESTTLEEETVLENEEPIQSSHLQSVVQRWRKGLETLVLLYEIYKPRTSWFTLRVFVFFTCTNIFCYWLALSTAFPSLLVSYKAKEYFWLQLPVGLLGASFDTASFFITVWIAKNALNSKKTWTFILHLSLDLVIAFLATMWVVLVFIVSGWVMSYILGNPEQLSDRSYVYQGRLLQALLYPFENIRNIYFGLIMGFSAALPSCIHFLLFVRASILSWLPQTVEEETHQEPEIDEETPEDSHTEMLGEQVNPTQM